MDLRTMYVSPEEAPRLAEALQTGGYAVPAEDCAGHLKRLIDTIEPADVEPKRSEEE